MGIKEIFILGTTEYAFMLHKMIEQEKAFHVIGHTCSDSQVEMNRKVCYEHNTELFALERLSEFKDKIGILNALGYSNMNRTREKLYHECKQRGYDVVNFISNRAIVLSDNIGDGNIIFPSAYIGTNVKIGSGNVFYSGCVMTHDIEVNDFNFVAANSTVGGGSTHRI